MSWRTGSSLFLNIWPEIRDSIEDQSHLREFTLALVELFAENDMDVADLEHAIPELDEILGVASGENYDYDDDGEIQYDDVDEEEF